MKKSFLFLILILGLCLIFHLLLIGKVPPGLTNDEVNIGYDAYCLLKTGKDQWGKSFPLEFKGFGDYRLPVFTYLAVPSISLFGLNAFSLRLTGIFFAILFTGMIFLMTKELFNETVALLASLLLVISPWFFSLTRFAIESPPATFFVLTGVYFLIKAFKKEKFYLPSFVFFTLSFYTYYSLRLFVPLFLVVLFFVWRKKVVKQQKWLLISLGLSFVFCLPIFISLLSGGAKARLMQTNLTKDLGLLSVLNQKRGECVNQTPFLFCCLLYNKPVVFFQKFLSNYINHFSFDFLFLKANAFGVMGESKFFYLFMLPLFLAGLFFLSKEKKLPSLILFTWLLTAPIADSLTSEGHFSRAFLMVVPICLIAAWGLFKVCKNIKAVLLKKLFVCFTAIFLVFETSTFLADYFFHFPKYYSFYTHWEYQPLFEYLTKIEKNYSQIYISRRYRDTKQYAFYLFYSQYNPLEYQRGEDVEWEIEDDGWIWIKKVGKWHFLKTILEIEKMEDKSLLVGATKEEINKLLEIDKVKVLKTIYFLNGDPAFSVVSN